jgi:predicted Zn-dependent protease
MAESYLLRRLQYEPGSVQHRIDLARALVIQQREQDAFQKLSEGIELSKTEPANTEKLQAASAEVLVQFVVRLNSQGKPNETLLQRLKVVNTALRVAPNNNAVINAVIEIVLECEQNKDQQVAALRSSLLKGAAPEAVHFIMGTLDLIEGRVDSGLSHLEIAKSSGLNTPGILNNLAMALIESGKEESSERALELSNAAIKGLPDHPYLRDTRGQILFRMKRYTDAIPELEYALQAPELAGNLHRLLAESYSAIGQADLAKDHLKLHQELTQARPK